MEWGVPTMLYEKCLNPRQCIEEAILYFDPTISDKDLLDLRESIYLKVYSSTRSTDQATMYGRDYTLYTRKKTL